MKFTDWANLQEAKDNHAYGTFVAAWVDKDTQKKITDFADEHDIPNQVDYKELHTTISYSRKGVPEAVKQQWSTPITAKFKEWKLFPNKIEGGNYLVAIVDSPKLDEYHKRVIKLGGTHDFPEYHSHISISADYKGDPPKVGFDFGIKYNKVMVKPIDPNFKPKRKLK
jgi:hypothetical protein